MIIVLGGSGYVGQAICEELAAREIPYTNVSRKTLDYTQADSLKSLIESTSANFLINCAGYTGKPNVDACEIQKTECLTGNAVLPGTIKNVCNALGLTWGHISSGCIYTGSRPDGSGFTESDTPNFTFRTNNCSWYSGCKALGEEILADADNAYIWRLRIPFNNIDNNRNYLSKLLRYPKLLEAENSISHLDDFAKACIDCWIKKVPFGTYNVTNTGSVTTREVVEQLRQTIAPNRKFEFFASEEEFMQIAAKTPRSNCVMDNSKLLNSGVEIRSVQEAIEHSLENWTSEN